MPTAHEDHDDDPADNHVRGPEHHDHGHAHGGPGHSHAPKDFGRAFVLGAALNVGLVVAQVVFGLFAHSLALLADAGHTTWGEPNTRVTSRKVGVQPGGS